MNYRCIYILFLLSLLPLLIGPQLEARDTKGRFVVVIDPGHGGKDSGALGKRSKEKDIVLEVGLKVGKEIKALNPNITIYYTRQKDQFIGLQERANFANQRKADLFVSIHANSHRSGTPHGSETYVLGLHRTQDNLDVAMKENSAILYESDHSVTYQNFDPNQSESYIVFNFIQNKHLTSSIDFANEVQAGLIKTGLSNRGVKQAGFLVLREVAMPSVLVELGFISNKENENYMLSEKGSTTLAKGIANAVVQYERKLGNGASVQSTSTPSANSRSDKAPKGKEGVSEKQQEVGSDAIYYRVQVLADTRRLEPSYFGKWSQVVGRTKVGKYYRYTLYNTTSLEEAKRYQQELRRGKYKDCFIVAFDADNRQIGSNY